MDYYEAVGRRKAATARARLYPSGAGVITINDRPSGEYFVREVDQSEIAAPLQAVSAASNFTVTVHVNGGGMTGQADAVKLAIARALIKADPDLRPILRKGGFLTRDARVKERKKPGLKRARKAPQYTKR
ncbi:MAG: 30S ribosomal protein S9 [Chloroflexi bacterium]|nr:30S ribosomal protein S9 [Chloroflexota bacterium]